MTHIVVGLVDTTGRLDPGLVSECAAALNAQATQHLTQFWSASATVSKLDDPNSIPLGVWPIKLVERLPPGEGGFHLNSRNQPFAEVIATPNSDGWTVAASHELIEMLIDPYGNRLQAARAIDVVNNKPAVVDGKYEYLVEACDPCESDAYSYSISGVAVSDFITPRFYDGIPTPGTRYSYTGAISAPMQVLPGGYISWIDPTIGEWRQLQYIEQGAPPKIVNLGAASGSSLREWIHTRNADAGLADTRTLSTAGARKDLTRVREYLRAAARERSDAYVRHR